MIEQERDRKAEEGKKEEEKKGEDNSNLTIFHN